MAPHKKIRAVLKTCRDKKITIKMAFKLQFRATQVPRLKKPALFVSLMPEGAAKPTFTLDKTAVQEGTCTWEEPVYVDMKLVKRMKIGKFHEKIYHLIVSNGSSKSDYLGKASIDFADYAVGAEPVTVSLPLKSANSGAVLNVTIQKMLREIDSRNIDENGESKVSNDVSMKKQMQNEDADRNDESFAEDRSLESEEEGSFRSNVGSNAITSKNRLLRRSSTASDGSLFDSINALEDNLPRESQDTLCDTVEKLKTEASNLMTQVDLSENKRAQDLSTQIADLKVNKDALKMECEKLKSSQKSAGGEELPKQLLRPHQRSSTASDGSINSLEDHLLRESQDTPSDTVEKLKTEVSNLMTQADLSELEMQSLKKQIMEENRRAQDLSTQIVDLKVERDALKMEWKKAMEEAEELRLQNKILEDELQKAAEELVLTKDQNKVKVEEVSTHLDLKTKHVEQMSLELEDLSNQLRDVKKREEEKQEAFAVEIQMLKARIEKLNEVSNVVREHSKQDAELRDQAEQMRISLAETRNLLESSKRERDELQRNFELAKKESRKTQEELCTLRSLKEEKDTTIKEPLSEMEMLRTQHEELRHCLSSDELQKETLQKQILQLKDELHKVQDVRKVGQKNIIQDLPHSKRSTTNNKLATKEDNAAILERNESDLAELLKEMTLLKERNKSLESELKEMEERYAEISFKFATAESARQELEMTNRQLMNGDKN